MNQFRKVVILTGAGISAESGLSTFRDADGLWENHRIEDVATVEAFDRDPQLVHQFYNARRAAAKIAQPNAAHLTLATIEPLFDSFLLVTQNVDNLHQRAGSENLIAMHGQLNESRCVSCHEIRLIDGDLSTDSVCPQCHKSACLRPNIVWFGEMPLQLDTIMAALMGCDLFVAIGTSGNVYPAAGFVEIAKQQGAHTVLLNLESPAGGSQFSEEILGSAAATVPEYFLNKLALKQN